MKLSHRLLLFFLSASLLAGCAVLESKQSEWIFRPVKENWRGFAGLPDGAQDVWLQIDAKSDHKVHAWWMPQADPRAPALLYLHGSRWNLSGSTFRIQRWRDMGFSVLAIDYRGFGQSSGELPTEATAYEDAAAAWAWLRQQVPDAGQRYLYGHSLGGAVAIDLAARLPAGDAAGLITESTFTSVPDVVSASQYGWIPVGFLISQRFASFEKIARVQVPTLFMHGTADNVIPHTMSDELYKLAREPKKLVKFEGASHSGIAWAADQDYAAQVRQFVAATIRRSHAQASARSVPASDQSRPH